MPNNYPSCIQDFRSIAVLVARLFLLKPARLISDEEIEKQESDYINSKFLSLELFSDFDDVPFYENCLLCKDGYYIHKVRLYADAVPYLSMFIMLS
jgi:hypothetical protein